MTLLLMHNFFTSIKITSDLVGTLYLLEALKGGSSCWPGVLGLGEGSGGVGEGVEIKPGGKPPRRSGSWVLMRGLWRCWLP